MNNGLCAAITGFACSRCARAVDALDQHGVHFRQQRRDVGHDLDALLGVHLFGELVDASGAVLDVLAAALVSGHDARAGNVIGSTGRRSASW